MTQPKRPLTIVFIPDPLLSHAVTSSGKGGTFEMVRSFGPESVKHLFNAAPGCWLEIEQAVAVCDEQENGDGGYEPVDGGRGTVDANEEAADASEGTAAGGQDSRIARDTTLVFWEWAYLPEAWRMLSESREDLPIRVIGMDYSQFMGAIMSRSEEDDSWRTLLDADLIVGGAALNEDFMDPLYLLNSDPQCLRRYLDGVTELEKHTPIWPPPKALLSTGNKVILANTLSRIAVEITHTPRPPTYCLPANPIGPASAGFVRKRGYSAHADHVVFDRPTGVNSVDDLPLVPSPSGSALIDESWHEQEFIDTLHDPRFGELRCYVVGGEVRRVLKTVPVDGKLRCQLVEDDHPTLEQYYKSYRGHNSEDRDPTPRHHSGIHELKTFVLATHAALVDKEKQRLNATRTDLEVLCRIDVGVLIAESAAHYFVLEVERGLTTCMFAFEDPEGAAADIEEVAKLLLDWVA